MVASDDTKAAMGRGAAEAEPRPIPAVEAAETAPGALAPGAASASAADNSRDYSDPMTWQVPVICKDCNKGFEAPYRHFQAGVVFHCPYCHGSFVPTSTMYRSVRAVFEAFFARRRTASKEAANTDGGDQAWRDREARELEDFRAALKNIAIAMRPAGKMVRKGWLASMFS
ncbi:MAG: hypothetical protein ABSG46_12430 [Candidatus Binataceae bacterium]|jgi:hypothetical protein